MKATSRTTFEHKRCLIPVTGYYYLIHLPGELPTFEPFAFAGISAYNKALDTTTFAIVTLDADPAVEEIHNRMPVILKPDALEGWFNPDTGKGQALELLQENRGPDLIYYPVDREVGNVRNKEPELINHV